MDVDSPQRPQPMTTNTSAGNVIEILSSPVGPAQKRKCEDRVRHEGKENGDGDKRVKLDSTQDGSSKPLVELKGKKMIFKEEAAPWSIPKRRLLRFSTLLLDAEEEGTKLTEFPSEYYDLVVLAGHELASINENALVKAIRTALCKDQLDSLPAELLIPLIPKLFTLTHYGLLPGDFPSSSTSSNTKIPAGLQIRRWEANEPEKYFPTEHIEAVNARKAERLRVREECVRILRNMDDIEAHDLVKGDKEDKKEKKTQEAKPADRGRVLQSPSVSLPRASREGTAATNDSRRSASPSKKSKLTPEEEEAARLKKEEQEARKAEKAEKKAARDAEQKKKDDDKAKLEAVHAKQANMFGSFFKAKSKPVVASTAKSSTSTSPKKRESTPEQSDFDQVFKPHVVRPGTRWAPINSFASRRTSAQRDMEVDVDGLSAQELLADHLRKIGGKSKKPAKRLPPGIKSGSPYGTVGEAWLAYQDAADPRKVLSQLRKQHKYPWKLLAFDQQARPPYSGTFTKRSAVVGPRTPFAQDPIFDYTYDSGDDWEEDEGGDDVDDFGEQKPEEEEEEIDSDQEEEDEFDDWLDDTEDAGYAPIPVDDDNDSLAHAGPPSRQERSPINVVKKTEKPRKIVKIVPSWKGPIWETEIGKNDEFAEYRLQLLNDTPDSFDPFTYVSNEPAQAYKATTSKVIISAFTVSCLHATSASTVVAPTPPTAASDSSPSTQAAAPAKPRPSGPKIGFPATHLAELYSLIHGNTKIKPDLVAQLRQQFEAITTKAAIEAKVKEVAVREGKTKDSQWKVKTEAWIAAGLPPPAETLPITEILAKQTTA